MNTIDNELSILEEKLNNVITDTIGIVDTYITQLSILRADNGIPLSDAHKKLYYPFATQLTSICDTAETINVGVALAIKRSELECNIQAIDRSGKLLETYIDFRHTIEEFLDSAESALNASPFSPSVLARITDTLSRQLSHLLRK